MPAPKLVLPGHGDDTVISRQAFRRLGCGFGLGCPYMHTMIFGNLWTVILARLQDRGQTHCRRQSRDPR